MGQTYPIAVENSKNKTFYFDFRLRMYGLTRDGSRYTGHVSRRKMGKIERYCRRKHLKYYIDNEYGKRSSNYRQIFFQNSIPAFGSYYFCAYCGFPVRKDKVTVDHLYPIAKAQKSLGIQHWMKLMGIPDVNSPKNLVPACRRCNQHKAAKMGIWIFAGYIGKIRLLWYVRWTIRFIVLAGALWLLPKVL